MRVLKYGLQATQKLFFSIKEIQDINQNMFKPKILTTKNLYKQIVSKSHIIK